MSESSAAEIQKHVKVYLTIFASLAVLTVVTVAVSYLDVNTTFAIILALIIASIKAGLVASYFMHLVSEKIIIYAVLILTMIFFFVLMFLVIGAYHDRLT